MAGDWRDIYSYLISDTPQNIGDVTNSGGGDDPRGTSGPLAFGTGKWNGTEYQVPDKYKGIIDVQHTMGGGEDPEASSSINIDYAKLPNGGMTPFGRVDRTIAAADPSIPVGPGQQSILKDPKLVYNDPNFGWITPASNRKIGAQEKYSQYMPALIMALASAGIGALPAAVAAGASSIPAAASLAVGAAKYAGGRVGPGVSGGNPLLAQGAPGAAAVGAQPQQQFTGGFTGGQGVSPQAARQLLLLARG